VLVRGICKVFDMDVLAVEDETVLVAAKVDVAAS
jgi:hypothetical protein